MATASNDFIRLYTSSDAEALGGHVRRKDTSAAEAVEAAIVVIERLKPATQRSDSLALRHGARPGAERAPGSPVRGRAVRSQGTRLDVAGFATNQLLRVAERRPRLRRLGSAASRRPGSCSSANRTHRRTTGPSPPSRSSTAPPTTPGALAARSTIPTRTVRGSATRVGCVRSSTLLRATIRDSAGTVLQSINADTHLFDWLEHQQVDVGHNEGMARSQRPPDVHGR
jgi:hypothetical protein